jgi:hypothetical protein
MLASNFASFHEIGDDKEANEVLSFEIKPKSGVTEFVPSCVHKYIDENKEQLSLFLSSEYASKFLNNNMTKFHVMQVSRM